MTLFLIKNPQIFRSQAGNEPIVFKDINGQPLPTKDNGMPYTNSTKIKIEITAPHPPTQQTVLGQAIDILKERAKGKPHITPTPTPSPTAEPNPSPAATHTPTPTPSPTPQEKITTVSYKLAEDPISLENTPPQPYNTEPTTIDYEFRDKAPGIKSIFVKFIFSNGTVSDVRIRQIELAAAPSSGINFKTYKGLNLPWGINDAGGSTFNTWFVTSSNPNPYAAVGYHEQALSKAFDHIKSMGVKTVGIWLWFDRMLIKDSSWGTDSYRTQFDPAVKANWESFLKNVIKPKDMELIVTMFPGTGGAEREPYKIDWNTFVPVFAGNDLLGAGVGNGDMMIDVSPQDNFPDNWSINLINASKNSYSWESSDGTPGSPAKYLKLISQTSPNGISLTSPKIPYTNKRALLAFSATYKGDIKMFYTDYYDSSDNLLGRDWVNRWGLLREGGNDDDSGGYSANWTTITWAGRTANIPAGTVKIAITAETKAGTTYIGPVRIAPGERSAKWRNYMQAVREWVSMYGSNTEYGPAVAAWQGIKEVSDGGMFFVTRDFSKDFYQTIKSTGTIQPVGIDNSPYVKLPVTDPVNLPWYNDAADYYNLHIYKDDGVIPDTSKLDKPFIIGELGANWKCDPTCPAHLYDMNGTWNLDAVRNFYTNGLTAGAKTVMAWSWNDNGTITNQRYENKQLIFTLGNAGQWIQSFNP